MDLDALDVSKENIQPLRRGRNLSVLGTALMAQTDTDVHQQLIKERDQFEILIRSYDGDDPLQHWYNYVLWVEQHFPKQGKEGNLLTLLERCLDEFKESKEYSQDVRYIDLWIRYMSFVKDPMNMYKQIYSRGIGIECAFLYICWAGEFEDASDFKRADEIYLKGIKRKAQPFEELERAHTDFQLRLARRVLSCGSQEQEEHSKEKRSTLSTLRAHGRRKNVVSNARVGSTIQHHKPGILPSLGRNTEKGRNNNSASTSKILVYKDDAVSNTDPDVEPILKASVFITQEIDKENTKNAGRWNEGKFKIRNKPCYTGVPVAASSTRVSTFHVHEDECCDTPKVHQSDIGVSNILKTRRMEDEPFIPVAIFEPHDETKKAMYPKHKVYCGSTEFSLEELRAIRYLNRELKIENIGKRHSNTVLKCEDLLSQQDLLKPKQKTRHSDDKLCNNEDVSSLDHDSRPTNLLAPYIDVENPPDEINFEPNKNQKFSVYVDSEDNTNSLPKSKQKNNCTDVKSEVHSDNTFELRKKEFDSGRLPGNFLKVPFLPGARKAIPKLASSIKAPTEKDHDQSLTLHTREAWNMMQDLFKSPSAGMKYEKGSFQLSKRDLFLVDKNITVSQNPLPTPKLTPFKIFNESSATDTVDKSISLPTKSFKMSEIVDKIDHQDNKQATTTVTSENVCEEYCIDMAGSSEKKLLSDVKKEEASYQNATPDQAVNALYDSSANHSKTSGMSEDIPYIPSPGMTYTQKRLLIGTENKENMADGKFSSCTSRRSLAGVLEPARNVYFIPLEDQVDAEDEEAEGEVSDDTCCTAAFSHPLFTSTPFLKNQPDPNERWPKRSDDTVTTFSRTSFGTFISEKVSKSDDESSKNKLQTEADGMYILDSKISRTGSTIYGSGSDKHLTVIQNVTEEKISASSGRCQNSNDGYACSLSCDPLAVISESVYMQKQFPSLSHCVRTKSKLEKQKEKNLQVVQLSSERIYKEIQENFSSNKRFCVDSEVYLVKNILEKDFRKCVTWRALETCSATYVALEIYPRLHFWDFYIRREIQLRLKSEFMFRHFLDASKAFSFNDKFVVVSRNEGGETIIEAMKRYQSLMNSDLLEEDLMYLLGEVIRIVDYMHECSIVHGNLSWQSFGISCHDGQLSSLILFSYEVAVDVRGLESREQSEFFQYDYCGVAKMVYELLFQKALDENTDIQNDLEHSLPKSFNKNFWKQMFYELLKGGGPDLPNIEKELFNPSVGKSGFRKFLHRMYYSK